ncbi:MAG: hypothetical protein ACAH95_05430 [Fimbriimonas sp.]
MNASFERLLSGVIDYAGLFPPAQLDMASAVEHYLRYKEGSEDWIVNRFVCPTSRLKELADALDEETPFSVCGIGRPSQDRKSWDLALEQDAQDMNAFHERLPKAEIEAYEIRLPAYQGLDQCIKDLKSFQGIDVFVELPWGKQMDDALSALADTEWLGAKARTGGVQADAFPTSDELAGFLHGAMSLDLDFKLTAGLHHPFHTRDEQMKVAMHGFLNVLTASTLIFSEDLPRAMAARILEDEDRLSFEFSNEGLRWRHHEAGLAEIEEARDRFLGFGSCSVEEPLAELASEGLLSE